MKIFRNLLISGALLAIGSTAHAVIINFQDISDRQAPPPADPLSYGESAWTTLSLNADFGINVDITGTYYGSAAWAYLDSNNAGLGVCQSLNAAGAGSVNTKNPGSGSNLCTDPADDNVDDLTESLVFTANETVTIDRIWFNNNHDGDRSLVGDTITINGVGYTFTAADISDIVTGSTSFLSGDTDFLFTFAPLVLNPTESLTVGYYSGTAQRDEQFYVSGIEIRAVPEPGTLALLGAGLLGLGLTRRRRRA